MRIRRFELVGMLIAPVLASMGACQSKPSTDGASVPRIGSEAGPPACPDVCERFARLCSYAPAECDVTCEGFDEGHRLCIGQAASCQEAIQYCQDAPVEDGGSEEGGPSSEDGG